MRLEERVKRGMSGPSPTNAGPSTPPGPSTRSRLQNLQGTPGTIAQSHVSDDSIADYSVYTIKNKEDSVVAVLVETKFTSNSKFEHALAQVCF